jgi:3'(2'), 5'-bisphosphate nucleotidase
LTDLRRELEIACELARSAGGILMSHYAGHVAVEWKGKHDPVTAADREASQHIVAELHRRFPDDGVLSEEESDDSSRRLSLSRVWVVDPLDGTKEFIARLGEFAVMIGLAIDGAARLGAVYQPTSDKLYFASWGHGAFLREAGVDRRLQVSIVEDPANVAIAISRSRRSVVGEGVRAKLGIGNAIACGSLGLKLGLICEGKAHVYIQDGGTGLWDVCAPEAILQEAGGRVTDLVGKPLRYDTLDVRLRRGVLASNGALHERLVAAAAGLHHLKG